MSGPARTDGGGGRPRAGAALALAALALASPVAAEVLTLDAPALAGLSGHRPFWNRPVVLAESGLAEEVRRSDGLDGRRAVWAPELDWHDGAAEWQVRATPRTPGPGLSAFDAVHRSLLVRFPGVARTLAARVDAGARITRVELDLPFAGTERLAQGYREPDSFLGDLWGRVTPRWHAVAWALRRPWLADPVRGPTFNAYLAGAGYWRRFGAADPDHDRFPARFGPAEVSATRAVPLDLTPLLTDAAYGQTLGARLRQFEDGGVLVQKWETYDAHFAAPGYEWGLITGGRGILIRTPRLLVTLEAAPAPASPVQVPPAPDLGALARRLATTGAGGVPTAVLPSGAALAVQATPATTRPPAMPAGQWARVQALLRLGGPAAGDVPGDPAGYARWLDGQLATQPRRWEGFVAPDQLRALLGPAAATWPAPLLEHWRRYWTAWLMPDRPTAALVHPQLGSVAAYVAQTGDWRGNASFYREGYTRTLSTMNFNHTATAGALLGGRFLAAPAPLADGRFGLEHLLARLWAWYDGTTQESIDPYYLAITLAAQKALADLGPTPADRLLAEGLVFKTVEELAAAYHPGLRRPVAPATRTGLGHVLQIQDGVQHVLHTLAPAGALTDLDRVGAPADPARLGVLPVLGTDVSPRRVARDALASPWGPPWLEALVDAKPLPFEMISTFRQWGRHARVPKWKTHYLGRHYGVASVDLQHATLPVMALWRRTADPVTTARDLGLLTVRFGVNRTNVLDTLHGTGADGWLGTQGGGLAVLQAGRRLLVLASPFDRLRHDGPPRAEPIRSVQATLALLTLADPPPWEVRVDGQPAPAPPAALPAGARLAIRDGVSYLGIIPLPATDLGRDAALRLLDSPGAVLMQGGGRLREGLLLESYFYRQPAALEPAPADWPRIDAAAGGFVIELGDATEFPSFEAFERQLRAARLETRWDADGSTLHVRYASGGDTLEAGYRPREAVGPEDTGAGDRVFAYRRVNGAWPYLPDGVDRQTPWSQLGRGGRLARQGATLMLEPGRMGHLVVEPGSGTVLAAHPLPDTTHFALALPDGRALEADGRLGLARVMIEPGAGRVTVDYQPTPEQASPDLATALLLFGPDGAAPAAPVVTRNGALYLAALPTVAIGGRPARVIPLGPGGGGAAALAGLPARYQAARAAQAAALVAGPAAEPWLTDEPGHEATLVTRPAPGRWAFFRIWPAPTAFRATVPGGPTVASDGRLGLRRLVVDVASGRLEIEAPSYLQTGPGGGPLDDPARALVVFDAPRPPVVWLNGQPVPGPPATLDLDGRPAYVVPLDGRPAAASLPGLPARYRAARDRLPPA